MPDPTPSRHTLPADPDHDLWMGLALDGAREAAGDRTVAENDDAIRGVLRQQPYQGR